MSRFPKIKKIFILALIGIVIGVALVPRARLDGLLWSTLERMAASQGIALSCSNPKFGLTSVATGPCNLRFKAIGVSAEFLKVAVVGVFSPRVALTTRIFGENCEAEVSSTDIVVKNCGFLVTEVPQLVGFGFSGGRISFNGTAKFLNASDESKNESQANSLEFVTASFTGSDIDHPTLSTSKLGFGNQAKVIMIPAFSDGAISGHVKIGSEQTEVLFSELSSSIVRASSARFAQRRVNRGSRHEMALVGNVDFQLIGTGVAQYGPLLQAFAQGDLSASASDEPNPLANETPSDKDIQQHREAAEDIQHRYTALISGTARNPSFRVLKSSIPR